MQGKRKFSDYLVPSRRKDDSDDVSFFKKKCPNRSAREHANLTDSVKYKKRWLLKENKQFSKNDAEKIAAAGELYRLFLGSDNSPKTRCVYDETNDSYYIIQEEIEEFEVYLLSSNYPERSTLPGYAAVAMVSGFLGEIDANIENFGLERNRRVKRCDFDFSLDYIALCMQINANHLFNVSYHPCSYPFHIQNMEYTGVIWEFEDALADTVEKFATLYRLINMPLAAIALAITKHIADPELAFRLLLLIELRQINYQQAAVMHAEFNVYCRENYTDLNNFLSGHCKEAAQHDDLLNQYRSWKINNEINMRREMGAINVVSRFNERYSAAAIGFETLEEFNTTNYATIRNNSYKQLSAILKFLLNKHPLTNSALADDNSNIHTALAHLQAQLHNNHDVETLFDTFYQLLASNPRLDFFANLFLVKVDADDMREGGEYWKFATLQEQCYEKLPDDTRLAIINAHLKRCHNSSSLFQPLQGNEHINIDKSPYKELFRAINWSEELYKQYALTLSQGQFRMEL